MRTLGKGLVEIAPPQGFAAESASAAVILSSSHLGFALSTTQVATGSILGSGVGRRGATVRWAVAGRMVVGWVLTIPAAAVVGALIWWIGDLIGGVPGALVIFGLLVVAPRRCTCARAPVITAWEAMAAEYFGLPRERTVVMGSRIDV